MLTEKAWQLHWSGRCNCCARRLLIMVNGYQACTTCDHADRWPAVVKA